MKIKIWGDFACPFCYMGETLLEKVLKERADNGEQPTELEFHAYELSPNAPIIPTETMEQHFCAEHDLTPDKAQEQMARITKMAERAGLSYNLPDVQVCSTFDAHRLMKLAEATADPETVIKLNFALFHANFTENKRLSDHTVLRDIASSVGLNASEVEAVLSSDEYADAVRADEKETESFDLEFIPYLQFSNGNVLQGVLSIGAIRKAF